MAMNPMQKKARTSFLLGMFLTLIITGIVIAFLILQLSKLNQEKAAIKYQSVYVLSGDITSGDKLQGTGKFEQVPTNHVPNNAITGANQAQYLTDITTAKIALRKGEILTTDMVNADGKGETSDVRLQEYNMVVLPTQLAEGEYVDIRLRLPSGEDFIVLSKKYIEQANGDTIWVKVSEVEILTMSNAIVEAYIMQGSLLYATTYSDAGMQNQATPTYVPKQEVLSLISANPNIKAEAMNALADRLTQGARDQRGTINSAVNGYIQNALQNVESNTQEEIEKMQTARQQYVDGL